MKVQLLSTENGLKSRSLKRLAVELSTRLGYKVLRVGGPKPHRIQLRYGDQVNKLDQYKWFKEKGISGFEFTQSKLKAQEWVNEGFTVVGRETLTGSMGAGIKLFVSPITRTSDSAIVTPCLVYTKYKPKKREFRVHIFKDKVVSIVEKRKRQEHEGDSDSRIRNLANGYVFCQTVELTPELIAQIETVALKASQVCARSHFRGVDVGYNLAKKDVFVIEVNSAPGIEGSNVNHYCDAIVESL